MKIVGVSQKAVIFNNQGQLVVIQRGKSAPSNPLKWDLPGGVLDFGEEPRSSIIREIKEEAGLKVQNLIVFDVEGHINKIGDYWVTIAYKAKANTTKITLGWEHTEYKWVNYGEFAKLPSIPKIVRFVNNAVKLN